MIMSVNVSNKNIYTSIAHTTPKIVYSTLTRGETIGKNASVTVSPD